jgi:transposase
LTSLRFEDGCTQSVFNTYLAAVESLEERVRGLEAELEQLATQEPYRDPVGLLRSFRGIKTVTAMVLVTELHGFFRFSDPRKLMAYLGLVPSEASSGPRTRRGSITKSGNSHVRRALVEAGWHYRHRPGVSPALRKRREGQPDWVVRLADKAQQRLYRRFHRLVLTNRKAPQQAVVAVARELAGFVWAALHPNAPLPPEACTE